MLLIRYCLNGKVKDKQVDLNNCQHYYTYLKKKHGNADLILVENNVEYCVL